MSSALLRGSSLRSAPFSARPSAPASRARTVDVQAFKKAQKRAKVILTKDYEGLGEEGEVKNVPMGYWRNYLKPTGIAKIADASVLEEIRQKKEDEIRAKMEEKAQAKAFAQALQTIGKFQIKKKVGDKDQIFGSVSIKDVAEAIYQQTGKQLEESDITIPDIKSMGTYECTVKLHPEVTGTFSVIIVKDKQLTIKKK